MNPFNGGWVILLSFAVALVLSVAHLPESWPQWLGWLRPHWVLLVLFYWVLHVPHRLGLVTAWLLGLLVDVLWADPLGLNGALLAAVTYITWKFYERLRMYAVLQQCGVLFVLAVSVELLRQIVQDAVFARGYSFGLFGVAAISVFLWPFVYLLLQRLQRSFRVE